MALPVGKTPPYAEEIGESRIGFQSGLLGDRPAPRLFRVYTAAAINNPIHTIENLATKDGGERRGNAYPSRGNWASSGGILGTVPVGNFVLHLWTIIDHHVGTNVWILQADYVPFYITGLPKSNWSFAISSTLNMQPSYTELPWMDDQDVTRQRDVGTPRYIVREDTLYAEVTGTPPYQIPYTNAARKFTATSLNASQGEIALQLAGGHSSNDDPRNASLPRYRVGMDIPERNAVLTITKQIPAWNFAAVTQAMRFLGHVNYDEFSVNTTSGFITFADKPSNAFLGTMLFADFQCTPAQQTEATLSEPAFQITMQFQHNPRGWQHKIFHTYRFEDGNEALVYDENANPIDEIFHRVDPIALSDIVSAFA